MSDNPYQSPTTNAVLDDVSSGAPASASGMWLGFLIAPSVIPVSFVVALLAFGVFMALAGAEIDTASMLVLPVGALAIGLVTYGTAGLVGLPIVFYLLRRQKLTGTALHMAALLATMAFTVAFSVFAFAGPGHQFPLFFGIVFCSVAPPTLLSTTIFWLFVRDGQRCLSPLPTLAGEVSSSNGATFRALES